MTRCLGCTRWKHADRFLAAAFKVHISWSRREKREIPSKPHILAWVNSRAFLSHDDCSAIHPFASKPLHTSAFSGRMMGILRRTSTRFMGHAISLFLSQWRDLNFNSNRRFMNHQLGWIVPLHEA